MNQPLIFADCVWLTCADQRTEGGANQRLIASTEQTEPLRKFPRWQRRGVTGAATWKIMLETVKGQPV